jgi:hypothetical protein
VPDAATDREALAALDGPSLAVMMYGSTARGTATASSDIDVLQVAHGPVRHYTAGRVDVTTMSPRLLLRISRAGGLFALHLRTDGRVLHDAGVLRRILAEYRPPVSYGPLRSDLSWLLPTLAVTAAEFAVHGQALTRMALYLVRLCASAATHERGAVVTDADRFASALADPELGAALTVRRRAGPFVLEDLAAITAVLRRYLPAQGNGNADRGRVHAEITRRPNAASVLAAFVPALLRRGPADLAEWLLLPEARRPVNTELTSREAHHANPVATERNGSSH